MAKTLSRRLVRPSVARAAVESTRGDMLLYAGVSLMLFAGLRSNEVSGLLVRDWAPGEDPQVTIRGSRTERTIRVAPSAAAAVDAYLEGEDTEPEEPLLLGLRSDGIPHMMAKVFQDAMVRGGWDVGVHDLRRLAMAAVVGSGEPVLHVEAYFGVSKAAPGRRDLVPVREGYDREIVAVLERTFSEGCSTSLG